MKDPADNTSERQAAPPWWRVSGWYLLGLSLQVALWLVAFLLLVLVISTGGHVTQFRYVGF
jgi:hypothetical protein